MFVPRSWTAGELQKLSDAAFRHGRESAPEAEPPSVWILLSEIGIEHKVNQRFMPGFLGRDTSDETER